MGMKKIILNKEKIFALMFCLVFSLSLLACGNAGDTTVTGDNSVTYDEQVFTIHLSDTLGDLFLYGDWFGEYSVIDTPDEFTFEDCTSTVYYNENCETPYICVYTLPKEDMTKEDYIESELKDYGLPVYYQQMEDYSVESYPTVLMYTDGEELFDSFYYYDCWVYEDVDTIVEVDMISKAEEVQLGDSNAYIWVPVGYTALNSEDDKSQQFGTFFNAENLLFEGAYPNIWMGNYTNSYEFEEWFWKNEFDELPFSEEDFNGWTENDLKEDSRNAYFEALGYKYDSKEDYFSEEIDGIKVIGYHLHDNESLKNFSAMDLIYIGVGETTYALSLCYPTIDIYYYIGYPMAQSLHLK